MPLRRPAPAAQRRAQPLDSIRPIVDDVGVTVIDESAGVPQLDAPDRERLSRALDQEGVVAAMLIGSQARGTAGPLSDVDIAVWHEPDLEPAQRASLQLALASAAGQALRTTEVDVVMLNGAPPLLRHRAMRDGMRLVERDPKRRVRLEAKALIEFLDTQPLRSLASRGLSKRIREDSFGRPRNR